MATAQTTSGAPDRARTRHLAMQHGNTTCPIAPNLGIATALFQGSLRRVRPAYVFVDPSAGGWVATPRFRQAGLAVCGVMNTTRNCAGVLAVRLGCMWRA